MDKDLLLYLISKFPPGIAYLPFKKIMMGRKFLEWFDLLKQNEKKSFQEIREYQYITMKRLLDNAYKRSLFYKDKYDKAGFHPDLFRDLSDLARIPVLTRKEVSDNAADMILRGENRAWLYSLHTSGTTGNPLTIFGDINSRIREWASLCYIWEPAGYCPGDKRVEFRGMVANNKSFEDRPEVGVLRINVNRIKPETVHEITGEIVRKGYKYFTGYPGAIFIYAQGLRAKNITPPPGIKGIFLSSEMVYSAQIDMIQSVFKEAKIISFYGMAEKVALAYRNSPEGEYKFIPTYALVERDKNSGALIGTSFVNTVMPLIRYRTSDILSETMYIEQVGEAGTFFPVVKNVEGREADMLRTVSGELVSPASLTFVFKGLKGIVHSKIIQDSMDHLILQLEIKGPEIDAIREVDNIKKELKKVFGKEMRIDHDLVECIRKDASGKFKWVESKLTDDPMGENKGKVNIILSLDYEIFGEGSGDVKKHIIEPTNRMLRICDRYHVPLTIMFEIIEYLKFEEFDVQLRRDLNYSPAELMREQARKALSRGHDVQLHIHPQWRNAVYENGKWILSGATDLIEALEQDKITGILTEGKEKLLSILSGIREDYAVNTIRFTGYEWKEAPRETLECLSGLDIKAHSLAYYRTEGNKNGYWDLTGDGRVFEIPIFAIKKSKVRMFTPLKIINALYSHSVTRSGQLKKKLYSEIFSKKNGRAGKERGLYYQKWDMCKQSAGEMLSFLDKGLEIYGCRGVNVPLVMIGHSKDFLFSGPFEKFLSKAVASRGQKNIKFTTFQEFVKENL